MRIVLPTPTIANEFTDTDSSHNMLCGEVALACALTMVGRPTSADTIAVWLRATGRPTAGGTWTGWLADASRHWGVACSEVNWSLRSAVQTALSHGLPCVVAIYSDYYGSPLVPPPNNIGHFVCVYGLDAAAGIYFIANPGGGRIQQIPAAVMEGSAQNSSLIVGLANASSSVVFEPAVSAGGAALVPAQDQPMTPEEKAAETAYRHHVNMVLGYLEYVNVLGRLGSVPEVQSSAADSDASDPEASLWRKTGSPEAGKSAGVLGALANLSAGLAAAQTAAAAHPDAAIGARLLQVNADLAQLARDLAPVPPPPATA